MLTDLLTTAEAELTLAALAAVICCISTIAVRRAASPTLSVIGITSVPLGATACVVWCYHSCDERREKALERK